MGANMMAIIAAVLAFITIGGLGWVLVGGDDSGTQAVKRAQAIGSARKSQASARKAAAAANTPEARRKQIMTQLQEAEKQGRKARMTLSSRLAAAGLSISQRTFYILSAVLGVVALLVAVVAGLNIFVALGAALVAGLGKKRMKKFSLEFPNAVDVIVRGIKSGLPVHECFKIIARESPAPLGPEFQKLVEGLGVGMTLEQSLDRMYGRMPTSELRFFTIVIAIQQKTGGNLAEALGNLSTVLRSRRLMAEKIKALSSEAIASAGIIGSLPPVVMALVSLTAPAYMGLLFTDMRGQVMLLGAALWMSFGIFAMKKMINFKF